MDETLKQYLRRSHEEVSELKDKFREYADDVEGDDVKKSIDRSFDRISDKLKEALEAGEELGDTAQLKAHLGAMEARGLIGQSKDAFDSFLNKATKRGEQMVDEAELKAALAKMEAQDFWQEQGPVLREEFTRSAETMKEVTTSAIDEIRDQLKKWRS